MPDPDYTCLLSILSSNVVIVLDPGPAQVECRARAKEAIQIGRKEQCNGTTVRPISQSGFARTRKESNLYQEGPLAV